MNIFENECEINENTVVTLGKFDGLHEGHQRLIEIAVEEAQKKGYKSLVYTFNQNPKNVLYGEKITNLMSKEEKIETLERMGIDYIFFQDFTYDFSKMSPINFVKRVIIKKLKAKIVVVGFNYKFGKDAKGDVELLRMLGEKFGFEVKIIMPIERNGEIISSSMLRKEIIK